MQSKKKIRLTQTMKKPAKSALVSFAISREGAGRGFAIQEAQA